MCGIAGMLDLGGERTVPEEALRRMARAIVHRGPDEEGFFIRPGVGLASRRLSIVGLADGQQPMKNEAGNVHVVFNGELFDHIEKRRELTQRGHVLRTHCDTEILPHMWEDYQEGFFEKLRGQFSIALWDDSKRQLILGRDRFGIAPLFWTRQGDWLLFASEIKALLASGMVPARPDRKGIDQIFTFAALPGPTTCFEGVRMLPPAHYLRIQPGGQSTGPTLDERAYWKMDFPDQGQEVDGDEKDLVDSFEKHLLHAVGMRLRADVPVGSYLSGGVDSSMILALACHLHGKNVHTYTVRVDHPDLDELDAASMVARYIGAPPPIVQNFRSEDILNTYPRLIQAAEAPVIDTSCAALLQLAQKVNASGQKVVLTGEGADEWLMGYPWYKLAKVLGYLDVLPNVRLSDWMRRGYLRMNKVPQYSRAIRRQIEDVIGGPNAWVDSFGLLSITKFRFYSEAMRPMLETIEPWESLNMDLNRAKRWAPTNRGVWMAGRVTLAGHLLQAKGDRVAMHSSVEVRYPFLDEGVFDFTSQLHPKWKLNGFRDKHILRLLAERWVPPSIYKRGKVIFRAPLDSFHLDPSPEFINELLSEESLNRSGYFDAPAVHEWRKAYQGLREGSMPRLSVEMGLAAVVATQLWHHLYIDSSLCSLPDWTAIVPPAEQGLPPVTTH